MPSQLIPQCFMARVKPYFVAQGYSSCPDAYCILVPITKATEFLLEPFRPFIEQRIEFFCSSCKIEYKVLDFTHGSFFSHRSDRRTGQTRLGLTRCGASLERPTRMTMAPASFCVLMEMISSPGMCGSTQSRNISSRLLARSAQRGMGEILLATPGSFWDFFSSLLCLV